MATPELSIPDNADEVTAHWLQQALASGQARESRALENVEIKHIGAGLFGQILRCRLTWRDDGGSRPNTVIVKLHSSNAKTVRMARWLKLYRREYDYYQTVAPISPIRSPELFWGGFENRGHRFALVMEDMTRTRLELPEDGASLSQAKIAVRALAHLHARFWDKVDDPRLSHFPDYLRQYRRLVQLAYVALLSRALNRFGHCFSNEMRRLAERYGPSISDHMGQMSAGHRTFAHGDFRAANLFFDNEPESCVAIDWQNCGFHSALRDVAYFLSTSVIPEVRREIEFEVVAEYHASLCRSGVKAYSLADCWRDYRRVMLSCLIGPVLTCGLLDLTDDANHRTMETGWRRTLSAISELGADEFMPDRPRTFSGSNVFANLSQGAYHVSKVIR